MLTHYETLKVARDAPPEVIRMAYKVLCQKYHPDKYPDNRETAERITKELNAAYVILSDTTKRKAYDEFIGEMETKSREEKPRESARQDYKPKEEPKQKEQKARNNTDESEAKAHYKTNDTGRQPPSPPRYKKTSHEPVANNINPWRRFFARLLDYAFCGFIVGLLIIFFQSSGMITPKLTFALLNPLVFGFVTGLVWIPLEAFLLNQFGNTLGKALLGLHLENETYKKNYIGRAFYVWLIGMGAGLPFVQLGTLIFSYIYLNKYGKTIWDKKYLFSVDADKLSWFRWITACGLIIVLFVANNEYRINYLNKLGTYYNNQTNSSLNHQTQSNVPDFVITEYDDSVYFKLIGESIQVYNKNGIKTVLFNEKMKIIGINNSYEKKQVIINSLTQEWYNCDTKEYKSKSIIISDAVAKEPFNEWSNSKLSPPDSPIRKLGEYACEHSP